MRGPAESVFDLRIAKEPDLFALPLSAADRVIEQGCATCESQTCGIAASTCGARHKSSMVMGVRDRVRRELRVKQTNSRPH
jgi:hypothetical protein